MKTPSKSAPKKNERTERLAAALRENLKRRKAQARAQTESRAAAKERADKPGKAR